MGKRKYTFKQNTPGRRSHNKHNRSNRNYKFMLDMGRVKYFLFDLNDILEKIPDDSVRGTLKGNIYSKASKNSIWDAREYIERMASEGVIPSDIKEKLILLLRRYTRRR